MKRSDRIMNITLGISAESKDVSPPKRNSTSTLQHTRFHVTQKVASDVGTFKNYDENQIVIRKSSSSSSLIPDLDDLKDSTDKDGVSISVDQLPPKSFHNIGSLSSPPAFTIISAEKTLLGTHSPEHRSKSPLTSLINNVDMGKHCFESPAASLPAPLTPVDQRKDYADSPAAPLCFSSTPAEPRNNYSNSPAAPLYCTLSLAHQKEDFVHLPVEFLPPADQRTDYADSHAEPLPPVGQKLDYADSPLAPLYSPLTPAVKNCSTLPNPNIEDSPLPAMSPSTLELYNNLTESVNLEDFEIINSPLCAENNIREVVDNNSRKRGIAIEDTPSSPRDFSPDTSTDYVPDSDETDGSEADENTKTSRRKHFTVTAVVHNNQYDGPSGSKELRINTKAITPQNDDPVFNINPDDQQQKGRCKKGRKRKNAEYTLAERKQRKYANLPYKTKTKTIEPKKFNNKQCKCKQKCSEMIPSEKRKEEFEKYISLSSYEAQLLFILNNVKEVPKKRSYTSVQSNKKAKPKMYHRIYTIRDQKVCKDLFLSTFQITNQKVTTSLEKHRAQTYKDKRGVSQGGWNKTPQQDIDFIKDVINALPKYESHYTRAKNSQVMYLQSGMTVGKIYELYTDKVREVYGPDKKCVSLGTLKNIFYKHFNLRCKVLKSDTCNRCDIFANKLHDARSAEEKENIVKERDEHQQRAEDLRKTMNDDLKRAVMDDKFECLTFDLEKTLPLPRLSTNVIFYKRQLWLYNSGIHAGSNDSGHCYIWIEGEAGRGAQEVGSCLIKYIKTKLSEKVEDLVLWSDCCGGQNRNIKIVLMLKALLGTHAHLKTITLKYLESGHTWLPNDTDFSKIETQLKFYDRIYTADDYINVIKSCKKTKPLTVYQMQKDDFVGTSKIEKKITNRKTFVNKEKVNWLKTKEILLAKENKHSLFMRCSLTGNFNELNIEKKCKGQVQGIKDTDLTVLWPEGKEIAQAKLDDLRSLYDLIPMDCRKFYDSLKGNTIITDDVDGFGGEPDFEVDED